MYFWYIHPDDIYIIYGTFFLNVVCYIPVMLWNTNFTEGTDEARMNNQIRQIITRYKAWCVFIRNVWMHPMPIIPISAHPSTYLPYMYLVAINSVCSMTISCLPRLSKSLTYPHASDEARINLHRVSCFRFVI